MINIMSGQTAVTSTPNNAPQKKDKTSQSAQNAENTVSNNNSMQEDTAMFQAQTARQAEGNNPDKIDYQKESIRPLFKFIK